MKLHQLQAFSSGILLCLAFVLGMALQSVAPFAHVTQAQGIGLTDNATPAAPAAPAVAGARLTYQGRLSDSSGAPLNTSVSVVFKLYGNSTALLWTSGVRTVTPVNGLFTVYLGDSPDPTLLASTLPFVAALGVTVGADAEMTPRQAFNTVIGYSDAQAGVLGGSESGTGVVGSSDLGTGMRGSSYSGSGVSGSSYSGNGVSGSSITGAGVTGSGGYSGGVVGTSTLGNGVNGTSSSHSGVAGVSTSSFGVNGSSFFGDGVIGVSNSQVGVYGVSDLNNGVVGATKVITGAGVVGFNAVAAGPALQIDKGGIKATGAGIGTNTFAFIHQTTADNIFGHETLIDNVLTNGDQDAMLFVTHVNNPTGVTNNGFDGAFGVYYATTAAKWMIYRENKADFEVGTTFNVMVIKR